MKLNMQTKYKMSVGCRIQSQYWDTVAMGLLLVEK
jgi:hypothetical protein